ncbi:MAG: hypothetical protein JWO30_965 [Fibrobacteres bacterium]|nr:hypothetical protein [Fibrobacterota bacterium]
MDRGWTLWEQIYKLSRPGANFGYEAQAYVVFIIPMIFLAYYMKRTSTTVRTQTGFALLMAFLVSGLLISLSRTGMITLAACLFFAARGARKYIFLAIAAAAITGLVAVFPDNYFLQRYTMRSTDAYPMAAKLFQIKMAFVSVFSNPLNILVGNAELVNKSKDGGFNPHNQFMYDMMTKGVFTFLLGLAIFVRLFRKLKEAARVKEPNDALLARMLWLGLLSVFINCLSTQVLINSNTGMMLWLIVLFALNLVPESRLYRIAWK